MVSSALHGIFVSPGYVYNSRVLFFSLQNVFHDSFTERRGSGVWGRSLTRSLSSKQQFYRKPVWAAAPPEVKEALFQRRRGGRVNMWNINIIHTHTPPQRTQRLFTLLPSICTYKKHPRRNTFTFVDRLVHDFAISERRGHDDSDVSHEEWFWSTELWGTLGQRQVNDCVVPLRFKYHASCVILQQQQQQQQLNAVSWRQTQSGVFYFCLRKKKSAQPNTQEWRLVQIWPPSVLTVVAAARLVVARRCSSAIKSQ